MTDQIKEQELDQTTDLEDFYKDKSFLWKLMYSAVVAGKSAKFAGSVMRKFDETRGNIPIKDFFEIYDYELVCRNLKTGNYIKMAKCWKGIIEYTESDPNFKFATPQKLEEIHGIGPKTSRFFLMWINPDAHYAALDTHILKWLKSKGHDVPKTTPSGKKYLKIEELFLKEAKKRNMKAVELDWKIWDAYAHNKEIPQ